MRHVLISVTALMLLGACGPNAAEWGDLSKLSLNISEAISNALSPDDDDAKQCAAVLDKEPDCKSGKNPCTEAAEDCLERFPELAE